MPGRPTSNCRGTSAVPRWSRRRALGAMAGGLLLPWLHSSPARGQSTGAGSGQPPRRLVLLYNPNGTVTDAFWPQGGPPSGGAGASEAEFSLGPILEPLAPFRERLLLLRGLDLTVTDRRFGPGGPHQRGMGALFTGRELQQGTMVGGDGSLAGWANGVSVDQELVRRLRPPTLLPSLELGVRATSADVRSRLIYTGPGAAVPPINDPVEVFERLSGGFRALGGSGSDTLQQKRRMVLAAVQAQYQQLAPRVSRVDSLKLERHAEFLNGINRRLDFSVAPSAFCKLSQRPPALEYDSETVMPEVTRLQLDLLVLALSCDITRIASVQFSSAINAIRFPWVESLTEGHALSHRGPSDQLAQEQLITRSRWYTEQVAYFLQRLDSIPEGSGTMLDNTLVLWGNELSVGNVHSLSDIPFVMAGNVGAQLRTGRYLSFGGQPHNRLLTTVLNLMGLDDRGFGNPEVTSAGPLSGLTV